MGELALGHEPQSDSSEEFYSKVLDGIEVSTDVLEKYRIISGPVHEIFQRLAYYINSHPGTKARIVSPIESITVSDPWLSGFDPTGEYFFVLEPQEEWHYKEKQRRYK